MARVSGERNDATVRTAVRLRPEIAALPAYRQGRSPSDSGLKLSSNENPYPPLPGVIDAVAAAISYNRYPDAAGMVLRERLGERFGVSADEVHLGAGSVSILAQLLLAVAGPGDEVVHAWRSFEAYPSLVTVTGATGIRVPNRPDGAHDIAAMVAAVTDRTRAVIICTPNNPTGTVVTADGFAELMAAIPGDVLVILDEAYYEFVTDPARVDGTELIGRHPNVVVLRTFSKAYGLAALRLGYAIGDARVLDAARATAIPLSVTEAAQLAALASLEREDELLERVGHIVATRDRLRAGLLAQRWAVPEAQGNFVWLATGDETDAAAEAFLDADLAVRPFAGDGIRISVGEHDSVARVLAVAEAVRDRLPAGHGALRDGSGKPDQAAKPDETGRLGWPGGSDD